MTTLAERTANRSVADRHAASVQEITRIIEATYAVIERTGDVDPSIRDILREAKLSTPAFYRHFRSKDELFVVILDDGRRRLVDTIERRVVRSRGMEARVGAWMRAVLRQAADPLTAARTRPFVAHLARLVERYPDEHRESEQLLVGQLERILGERAPTSLSSSRPVHQEPSSARLPGAADAPAADARSDDAGFEHTPTADDAGPDHTPTADARADAWTIYHLTFGALEWYLRHRRSPTPAEIDRLVGFALRALRGHTNGAIDHGANGTVHHGRGTHA